MRAINIFDRQYSDLITPKLFIYGSKRISSKSSKNDSAVFLTILYSGLVVNIPGACMRGSLNKYQSLKSSHSKRSYIAQSSES